MTNERVNILVSPLFVINLLLIEREFVDKVKEITHVCGCVHELDGMLNELGQ